MTVAAVLTVPAPVKATYPTAVLANVYDVLKDIGVGVAKGFAQAFINQYLIKFVNKVTEKYKVRNYLYYDQVLTNYYLTNYIADKVSDPDLRRIYSLLNAAYITGQPTGATGYNPQNALIPQLKRAITNEYLKAGGVNPELIKNPPANMSDYAYFQAARSYYLNPPSYTAVNLQGRYGSFQSNATTAAQLEVIVGNGLKAGRFIGGTCQFIGPLQQGQTLPSTPDGCRAIGGTWQASALDQARSFIDNPASFVNSWMDKGIMKIMDNNYDPNNIWTQIGAALGSFIFNRLFLDRQGGVLTEDPRAYAPDPGTPNNGTPVDIDGDGVNDGIDTNSDGQPEICSFGGLNGPVGPPCKGSVQATSADGEGLSVECLASLTSGSGNDPGAPEQVDINNVEWNNNSADVSGWAETGVLSDVYFTGNTINFPYDKTNVWPETPYLSPPVNVVGNPWLFFWKNGQWHAYTWEWLGAGRISKDGGAAYCPGQVGGAGPIWYNFRPTAGDRYGLMISGLARLGARNVDERTNIFMFTWPGGITP